MSRGFGPNFGSGGFADSVSSGYSTGISGQRTYAWWSWDNGGTGNFERIFSKSNVSTSENFIDSEPSGAIYSIQPTFSGSIAKFSIPQPSQLTWHHHVVAYDG